MPDSPSGEQYELREGDQRAVVVELGGALRHYAVGDRPVLDGFAADERITGGRGQLLVPWPNRIRDGRYHWRGADWQLPLTEPTEGNSIHGLLRWTSWQPVDREQNRVVVAARVWPQPGYPFHLGVSAEYVLRAEGLAVAVTARNVGDSVAPFGVGQHPYLTVGTDRVDDAVLSIPAQGRLRVDERGTPIAAEPVGGTPYDFRTARAIGAQRLDTAFTELERESSGRAVVRLAHPSGQYGTDVWLGDGAEFVQVYTGDKLPEPDRRRGVAIEPMSCPPDAFRSGTAVIALEPGEQTTFRWGLTPWEA
jgi:aldose 1-epimerase